MEWVQARDLAGRVLALPNQFPGLIERLGLTRSQVNESVWGIPRRGQYRSGAAAVARVLHELGGPWRRVATLYRVRPLALVAEAFYRLFARHRGRFSRWGVTPACGRPNVRCTPEGE